jgi:hypothetical protein
MEPAVSDGQDHLLGNESTGADVIGSSWLDRYDLIAAARQQTAPNPKIKQSTPKRRERP